MTDHVHNQLCARIEELEKEKLELNEQLDALQREAAEAHRQAEGEAEVCSSYRGERDALAAHVERIITEWNSGDDLFSDEWISRMGDIVEDAPETSLSRLKAKWQAEALLDLHEHWRGNGTMRVGALLDKAIELQEEAEGGET